MTNGDGGFTPDWAAGAPAHRVVDKLVGGLAGISAPQGRDSSSRPARETGVAPPTARGLGRKSDPRDRSAPASITGSIGRRADRQTRQSTLRDRLPERGRSSRRRGHASSSRRSHRRRITEHADRAMPIGVKPIGPTGDRRSARQGAGRRCTTTTPPAPASGRPSAPTEGGLRSRAQGREARGDQVIVASGGARAPTTSVSPSGIEVSDRASRVDTAPMQNTRQSVRDRRRRRAPGMAHSATRRRSSP